MTAKNNSTASGSSREMSRNRVLWYTLFFILLVGGAVAVLWIGGHYLNCFLLTGNPRLALRKITVRSSGFWSGRDKQLAQRLGLRCAAEGSGSSADGLFAVQPELLRQKLLKVPGIKACEVRRVLPDSLDIHVVERLPRAALWKPNSPWLIDEDGVLFPRNESLCQIRQLSLPIITGYLPEQKLKIGGRCPGLENALELISLTVRNFPDLEIRAIDLSRSKNDKILKLFVRYRKMRECCAILPVNDRNYSFRLSELQSAILYAEQRGDRRYIFDLSFEGSAIIR